MKVLGVNFSHNCSFAYFENNVLKEYYEEDCDEVFLAFYEPAAMTPFGVYMFEGVWITPDGKTHQD